LSTAALSEAPSEPARGRYDRAIDFTRRHAAAGGLALWAGAAAALAIHSTGTALPDPTRFAMLDCWLVGLGSLGCPVIALRPLGCWLKPQACMLIAAFCFAVALLLTALTLGGALRFNTLDDTFALILSLAVAIQSVNAADAELHGAGRRAAAYQAGRTDEAAEQLEVRYRAVANLDRLDAMGVGELGMLIEVASGLRNAKLCDRGALRLVPAPSGGQSANGAAHVESGQMAANGHRAGGRSGPG
jgi:hypothetical protein